MRACFSRDYTAYKFTRTSTELQHYCIYTYLLSSGIMPAVSECEVVQLVRAIKACVWGLPELEGGRKLRCREAATHFPNLSKSKIHRWSKACPGNDLMHDVVTQIVLDGETPSAQEIECQSVMNIRASYIPHGEAPGMDANRGRVPRPRSRSSSSPYISSRVTRFHFGHLG
jgi:hypothetical protein